MRIFRKWRNPKQKPPFGAEIDWSDPITYGLVGCWLFNETVGKFFNLVKKKSSTIYSGTAYLVGEGLYISGDDSYADTDKFVVKGGSAWTCIVFAKAYSFSTGVSDNNIVQQLDGTGTSGRSWLYRSDATNTLSSYLGGAKTDSGVVLPVNKYFNTGVVTTGSKIKIFYNGKLKASRADVTEFADGNFRFGNHKVLLTRNWDGILSYILLFNRALFDSEIERFHYEPYSFFLALFPWFFIDLAAGQYSWNGNIPVNLIPNSVKEVRFYPQTGGAPIVITPQAQAQAAYKAKGEQNIALTPQGDIRAQYVEDGSVLVRLALAAEKQVRFLAEGLVPLAIVPACEAQAAYTEDGQVPLVLFPEASARARYAHQGEVPLALQVSADIACAFNVAGGLGLILLPQGTWTYVPVTGGAVYTWAGNIPVSLVLEADTRAKFDVTGQTFLTLTQTAEIATKYRHIGDLLLRLIPAGQATASWLLEGEIQLRLVPQGVAVLVKPSEQEDWYFVGVIEEDDIRAVFDDALHSKIWPRQ